MAEYELAVLVEVESGCIEIKVSGTGGGMFRQEIVLYKDHGGSPLIGVAITVDDAVGMSFEIYF